MPFLPRSYGPLLRRPPIILARRGIVTTTSTTGTHTVDLDIPPLTRRKPKKEGTIEDVFDFQTESSPPLPERFQALKKEIFKPGLVNSWNEILQELDTVTADISRRGSNAIPQIEAANFKEGLSPQQVASIKTAGCVIVRGAVPPEEALAWKESAKEYIKLNKEKVTGGPAGRIVFYEIYNSKAQIAARTNPSVVAIQRALLSFWHNTDPVNTLVDLKTPISYFDRLRIRPPGPSTFTLGAHIDGGGVERWEDEKYRECFKQIFEGNWKAHDAFDVAPRLSAKQDLYDAANQCTVFRPWQGWTSLSSTGANEGTLQVLPFLNLATAYIMLRPFFRLKPQYQELSKIPGKVPLAADKWEVDLDSSSFPGNQLAKTQSLTETTHPHLRLDKSLVSIPKVEPGDQVYWHCDLVHAVESQHTGVGDSSVFYIPAVPLTVKNAEYLRDQRENFTAGKPAPDFPGGEGESTFNDRPTPNDIRDIESRRLLGLAPFESSTTGTSELIRKANAILGF
ncbi:hypothetical protein C8Q75DRAFT_774317 [Abortiporus biennis]|nr:hypothetical protein C8Q75DRAFT_774317 [Abortiporus biennis]